MEVLDKKIKMALSKEVEEPYTYERTIKKALYKNKNYGIKHYIKKAIIIIASILSTLAGTFGVYAATGGKIEGMPAFDWIGLKFSEQYVEYKQPVENQVLAFENTSVELVSTLCNEGLTILEFDVKLSEEDYKKLKIDESVITDEFLQQMEETKEKAKDEAIKKLKQDIYTEEIQKGNYNINYEDIKLTDEQINKKYDEEIKNIENIDEFKKGYFTIQDISAGQTARILNPQPGELVLDACSAPGGKTTYMAELMKNEGKIEAWDIHEHRTKLVEKNAQRLGIDIIETKVKDASLYDESLKEKFNKILLDVPCLGIGVIKRKPDIKWKRKPEDVKNITEIQKKILDNCSKYLKKNGVMVYSTCSILEKENQDIVDKFLKENNDYYIRPEKTRNILPNEEKDGFFICKIYRK